MCVCAVSSVPLLLSEVLSGIAMFGGLVGRRGLGRVCPGGQGVGNGHPPWYHALNRPRDAPRSHAHHPWWVPVGKKGRGGVKAGGESDPESEQTPAGFLPVAQIPVGVLPFHLHSCSTSLLYQPVPLDACKYKLHKRTMVKWFGVMPAHTHLLLFLLSGWCIGV